MRKKKNNKMTGILLIVLLVIILIALINFSSRNNKDTKLDLTEKKWIENNKEDVINVSIANNIPVFSDDGEGVFFDFVDKLKEKTNLSFNLISYDASGDTEENDLYFEVLKGKNASKVSKDDMKFYTDYYVLIGRESEKISSPENIKNKKIGTLTDDLSTVSYYISSENGVTYTPYENVEKLEAALKDSKEDYIAPPKTESQINKIIM